MRAVTAPRLQRPSDPQYEAFTRHSKSGDAYLAALLKHFEAHSHAIFAGLLV